MNWLGLAFSEGGLPSSSRLMSLLCTLTSIVWGSYLVHHTGKWPDALSITALTGFSAVHYIGGRVTSAWGPNTNPTAVATGAAVDRGVGVQMVVPTPDPAEVNINPNHP